MIHQTLGPPVSQNMPFFEWETFADEPVLYDSVVGTAWSGGQPILDTAWSGGQPILDTTWWTGHAGSWSWSASGMGQARGTSSTSRPELEPLLHTGCLPRQIVKQEQVSAGSRPGLRLASRVHRRRFVRRFDSIEDMIAVSSFLVTLYDVIKRGNTKTAIDVIIRFLDRAMINRKLRQCDEALRRLDPNKLNASMMLAVLCITEGLGEECPGRDSFYDGAMAALGKQRGKEIAKRLLEKHK